MKQMKKFYNFDCPKCGHRFEATPDEVTLVGFLNTRVMFTCPVCGKVRKAFIKSTTTIHEGH